MACPPSDQEPADSSLDAEHEDEFFVVGIGASAGGVSALKTFFDHLSGEPEMAFVVVQHLAPTHESELPSILQTHTGLPVEQVTDQTRVAPGHVYVIPPGKTLSIEDMKLCLSEPGLPRRERAPIDLFFRSLAESQGKNAVGIVLSGTGSGGAVGLRAINEAGGFTLVQNPSEAEYPSMPRNALATGVVDAVLPLAKLTQRLVELRQTAPRIQLPQRTEALSDDEQRVLEKILDTLHTRSGHDFSHYKRSTILRRIHRRMQINNTPTLEKYCEWLQATEDEHEALSQELLISVTHFFRDPEAFEALEEQVVPELFAGRDPDTPIRVWVPGCATGEEAYSIAILLVEQALKENQAFEIQVFATDADETAIEKARTGVYSSPIEGDISSERLRHFFREEAGGYRVRQRLRERVVFAPHNLLKDPPFSNLDLLSCRNLLIYLQQEMQERILDLFHYSLRPSGILFVGPSESLRQSVDLFETVDKTYGIYRRRSVTPRKQDVPRVPLLQPEPGDTDSTEPDGLDANSVSYEELHRTLRSAIAPPSLLVTKEHDLVHVSEGAQQFLEYPTGEPTHDVLQIIHSELRTELRTSLFQVFRSDDEGRKKEVRQLHVQLDGEPTPVRLRVRRADDTRAGTVALIVLEEQELERSPAREIDDEAAAKIEHLEDELDQTREQLALTIEEYETQTEDLRASNEELQSMNEELKSTTEELETSKEELQSVNEELVTVNEELQDKNEELTRANSDLKNLMDSTGIGVIFLDEDLHLRRYTPPARDLFSFIPADEGRPLSDLRERIAYDNDVRLVEDAEHVLTTHEPTEREIQKEEGQWYLVRFLPYRTEDDEVDGVVITFIDITDRKETEIELRNREEELRNLNKSLEAQVQDRTQKVRELNSELALAQQEERERIASILHDELQQELHAVQMWIRALQNDELSDEQEDLLEQMHDTLDASTKQVQTLSTELAPPILEDGTLGDVLDWLGVHMEKRHGLTVDVESEDRCVVFRKELRILLFRLVRELLFNVVKHADSEEARLQCQYSEDDQVVIDVIDEGDGFDTDDLDGDKTDGFGLYSVRERLDMFGGRLELESAPGDGTHATILLPLDDGAEEG